MVVDHRAYAVPLSLQGPAAGIGPTQGYPLVSLTHAATLRAATGSVLYLIVIALLALGVAPAIRDTAVCIGAVLALLYLPRSSPKPSLTPSDDISSRSPPWGCTAS